MPNDPSGQILLEYTPEFKRNLRVLAKKYRHVRSDLQPVIDQLHAGQIVGDQVPGTQFAIFKTRVRNSDILKGKSSGYRVIYYLKEPIRIILVTIYSTLDQGDISAAEIRRILKEFSSSIQNK